MTIGVVFKDVITAGRHVVYTTPAGGAKLNITVVNPTNLVTQVCVGISTDAVAQDKDWVTFNERIQPNFGRLEINKILSPGENLTMLTDNDGLIVRVSGVDGANFQV
jgi:hypothetical protein